MKVTEIEQQDIDHMNALLHMLDTAEIKVTGSQCLQQGKSLQWLIDVGIQMKTLFKIQSPPPEARNEELPHM